MRSQKIEPIEIYAPDGRGGFFAAMKVQVGIHEPAKDRGLIQMVATDIDGGYVAVMDAQRNFLEVQIRQGNGTVFDGYVQNFLIVGHAHGKEPEFRISVRARGLERVG